MARLTVALVAPKASAGLLLSVQSLLLIPVGTPNDVTQFNPATLGFELLGLRSPLSPVTFIIGDPPGDHP